MSCICLCKDTNFKANHNGAAYERTQKTVVYAYAKILILKQITTLLLINLQQMKLYMPMQRY